MKIKFLILLTFCLFGLCFSQEENNQIEEDQDPFEGYEEIPILTDEEYEQLEAERVTNHQKVQDILEREKTNGGQCFLDAIDELNKYAEQYYPDNYEYQLFCFILTCGDEDVPSAEQFSSCIKSTCDFQYDALTEYYQELNGNIQNCLSSQRKPKQAEKKNTEGQKTSNSDNQETIDSEQDNNDQKSSAYLISLVLLGLNLILI
ncbi:hypothetical protein TTHERM_01499950 (macronuclear) [Tetrahymena thermophila SB210]|uniref:Transmembrane protein n=1 Tax=Tetrahymena thermophila (strain SB210) TaxID=312017 RepID=Q228T2_TETTS|nr:hypothetical protein TTHERM_01499950 [Tetrahymena thermophila SB210]EAR81803.1 hypothetical protein TTHERM_01499950 [Tetrahymena thermophila SB210]|eukprot:XP_001029466.1 hypothetical protein TTHERM_01499950 [Tetrahymena thermophila SB210]